MLVVEPSAAAPTVPGVPDLTSTVRAGCVASVVPFAFFTETRIVAACVSAASALETTVAESVVVVTVSPELMIDVDLATDRTVSSAM
jgi:hypothetical protein